jgi:23S rRNA pseudouridine1911/1915/1917 synthase
VVDRVAVAMTRRAATECIVPDDVEGQRVDRTVVALWKLPTAAAKRLCMTGAVHLDGRRAAPGDRVRAGQRLRVDGVDDEAGRVEWFRPASALPVLYIDDDVVVVAKPPGMPCHPLVPGEGGTAVDAVVAAFPEVASAGPVAREGGLLHRLDNDTSGCLALARTVAAFERLAPSLRAPGDDPCVVPTTKTYLAIVDGVVADGFVVEAGIDHDPRDPRRVVVVQGGRTARTVVTPRGTAGGQSLVELALHGGRRHQLRAHLAARGHALSGDSLYGSTTTTTTTTTTTFLLHAWRLGLPGRPVLQAPLPSAFVAALKALGLPPPG